MLSTDASLSAGSSEAARVLLCAHVDGPAAGGMDFEECGCAFRTLQRRQTRRAREELAASARGDRRAARPFHASQIHPTLGAGARRDQHTRTRIGRPEYVL